ncbi:HIRAN domain-containing protein [Fictibacillus sp. b24]|uniref:HIRAN domain-containing protein n=1 Tax=Fictibacillus sp. b24 TaxID=3055863 RepID=UPI0025A0E79B|nr:HIRAN domain-containing protein [Fictibacillus sp. b24]MDM5314923.1 HIRAN domain-containing protein [Fictibacillus sp. b24]
MTKVHFHFTTNLAGVTYEGRQEIIAQTKTLDPIKLKRDKNNQYDRNAVGVYNARGKSLGWVPKGYAANIAPHMDKGIEFYAEIKNIVGGNGYNYGVQVRISNDLSKMRDTSITRDTTHTEQSSKKGKTQPVALTTYNSTSQKRQKEIKTGVASIQSSIATKSNTAVAVKSKIPSNISELIYLDSVLLRHVNKELYDEVQQVLLDFARYKKATLPYMNRQKISGLLVSDLESIFDNTIMLAGGSESNFVHRHYKALLVQLAFQLGFLIERLIPESQYATYAKNKMNWLSTMDVRLETNLLQGFFNENVKINGESPVIYDSYKGNQVSLWDIDEIHYVLSNLTELGSNFKRYIDKY